jgi:hypothetical protein
LDLIFLNKNYFNWQVLPVGVDRAVLAIVRVRRAVRIVADVVVAIR